jgi:glycosyltransferase involved in cell wall biosynthesis
VTPVVSIAMPFYNSEPTLAAALQSLLAQTFREWELLLCDDGSSDGGLKLARGIGDSRIVIWSDGRRKGLAARLNECIARARGVYVARMDADDISYPDRLEKQVRFLDDRSGVDLAGTQMLVFGEEGEPLGKRALPCEHEGIVARPELGFGIGHPTWMGRTSWFRRYGYRPEAVRYEDVELLYRSYRESRYANLPELLYGYREPRGGFAKRLKTRIGRVQYLRNCAAGLEGAAVPYQAALAESVKAASDAVIVAAGMRYRVLRTLEAPLSGAEKSQWVEIFRLSQRGGMSCYCVNQAHA